MPDDDQLSEIVVLLIRARRVLTDSAGWDDDEATIDLVQEIDIALEGNIPPEGRGAYDDN